MTSVASRCSHTGMGVESGSVCGQKGTMKDIFARCLKRADVQVCTLIVYTLFYNANSSLATYVPFFTANNHCPLACTRFCDYIITGVYFSQVENKPWIPWVYTWSWHCREQDYMEMCKNSKALGRGNNTNCLWNLNYTKKKILKAWSTELVFTTIF
jgi:hypothetical protein